MIRLFLCAILAMAVALTGPAFADGPPIPVQGTGNKVFVGGTAIYCVQTDGTAAPCSGTGGGSTVSDTATEANTLATANVAGAQADAAWSGTGNATLNAVLKAIWAKLNGTLAVGGTVSDTSAEANTLAASTVLGTQADAAWGGTGNATLDALLKAISTKLGGTLAVGGTVATTAADLTAIPVSGSVTSAAAPVLFTVDTTGYGSIAIQITSIGTGNTVSFQGSNDNATWTSALVQSASSASGAAASNVTSVGIYVAPATARYFRAAVTTYITGTVSATAVERLAGISLTGVSPSSSPVFPVGTSSTSGTSIGTFIAPATPAVTVAKATSGRLYKLVVGNSTASAVWVKIYNTAAPTLGTTAASLNIFVAAGQSVTVDVGSLGFTLGTAISIAVTGGASLTDNTSITSTGNAVVSVNYIFA